MKYLLDTHTWVWWQARPDALSFKVRRMLTQPEPDQELLLSAISVWEFCKWIESGRMALSIAPEDWIHQALDIPGLRLVPLSPRIAWLSSTLPAPFEGDAIDQIIAATAREEHATILTKDEHLQKYQHVKTLW